MRSCFCLVREIFRLLFYLTPKRDLLSSGKDIHRLRGRSKKVFGRVFVTGGRESAEVTREWRKLYNKDLCDLLLLLLLLMSLVIIIIIIIIIITGVRERAKVTREWRKLYNKDLCDLLLLLLLMSLVSIIINVYYYYYYYHHHHHHHRIFHFSALAGKYSPILGCSNQQDYTRWSNL